MELFRQLRNLLTSNEDYVQEISDNNIKIQDYLEKINNIILPFETRITLSLKSTKLDLNEDKIKKIKKIKNQLDMLFNILNEFRAEFSDIYYQYEELSKPEIPIAFERDPNLGEFATIQLRIIILLKKVLQYLKLGEELLQQTQQWNDPKWTDTIEKTIRNIINKLGIFSDIHRKYVKLDEELYSKTMSLINEITKNYEIVKIRYHPTDKEICDFCYYISTSEKDLSFLKYVPVIDFISHKHSMRTKIYVPLHTDDLTIPHYNIEFESEPNIHVIPKEYTSKFYNWLKNRAA